MDGRVIVCYIIRILCFGIIGGILGLLDITPESWQFWAILVCAFIIEITSLAQGKIE